MLMVTPATRAMLRTRPRPRKLRQAHRASIVQAITACIREDLAAGRATTLFTHEATIRQSLRAGLCLASWPWRDADTEARAILDDAFKACGAKRPTWAQGQPEWTDGGVVRTVRTRCANCEKPLEEDQHTFCSKQCYDALHARRRRLDDAEAIRAMRRLNELSHG